MSARKRCPICDREVSFRQGWGIHMKMHVRRGEMRADWWRVPAGVSYRERDAVPVKKAA